MNVVILLNLQAERGGEGQVLQLHRVNVHLLWRGGGGEIKKKVRTIKTYLQD